MRHEVKTVQCESSFTISWCSHSMMYLFALKEMHSNVSA